MASRKTFVLDGSSVADAVRDFPRGRAGTTGAAREAYVDVTGAGRRSTGTDLLHRLVFAAHPPVPRTTGAGLSEGDAQRNAEVISDA
jgi:hypothetical protein